MESTPDTHARTITYAINTYGSGMHPVATVEDLDHFTLDYQIVCMVRMMEDCMEAQDLVEIHEALCDARMMQGGSH